MAFLVFLARAAIAWLVAPTMPHPNDDTPQLYLFSVGKAGAPPSSAYRISPLSIVFGRLHNAGIPWLRRRDLIKNGGVGLSSRGISWAAAAAWHRCRASEQASGRRFAMII